MDLGIGTERPGLDRIFSRFQNRVLGHKGDSDLCYEIALRDVRS